MKKSALVLVLALLLFTPAFADYSQDMSNGYSAYNAGDLKTAYDYYVKAYKENPNRKLFDFIVTLRKKMESQTTAPQAQTDINNLQASNKKQGPISMNWWIIGADAALAGFTVYEYINYNNLADDYDSLYNTYNDTTHDNYLMLLNKKSSGESQGNIFGMAAGITGAAVLYTVCDAVFFHALFPIETSMTFGKSDVAFNAAINMSF
jgi:hypothetical protein